MRLLLSLLLFAVAAPFAAASAEERIALVIGNGGYSFSPLANPVNDARTIASVLKQAGFDVRQYENLGQAKMKRAILRFGAALSRSDVGLFYYAGHGVQVNGRNYLIPVDANIQYENDIEIESVDLASVLSKMKGAGNRLNIVILDACRNNPFTSNSRTLNQGLAFTNAPSGTLIAYATAPGGIADDGDGRNGIYTQYLAKHILTPGTRIEDVFKRVRVDVRQRTNGRQVPWESSSLEGDFYFYQGAAAAGKPSASRPVSPATTPLPKRQASRILAQQPRAKTTATGFNCTDLREKEAFSGDMGFGALSSKEQQYLDSHCQ